LTRDTLKRWTAKIGTGTLLVLQSGGPTAVMNASLVGVIRGARDGGRFGSVLGSRRGVEGILNDDLVDLSGLSEERLDRLRRTPSAALGTSRRRPTDDELGTIVDVLTSRSVIAVVGIGGNDTAETLARLAEAGGGSATRFVGVPKTIDNDLPEMDHCPGYGSAARFMALAVRESALDTAAMAALYPLKIIETMGRNAGWLVAAGSLLFDVGEVRPLLCLPERPFGGIDDLAERIQRRVDRDGHCVVVAPETMRWVDGSPVGGTVPTWVDQFGHPYFPGVGDALCRLLEPKLGTRARYDKPGTIARMAMHAISTVDVREAEGVGEAAAALAHSGATGVMVSIERRSDAPYEVHFGAVDLRRIANTERRMPDDMLAASGDDTTARFRRYALPLIGEPVEPFETLSGLPPG